MEIMKTVFLNEDEFVEAISEYLSKRDVTFNIDSIVIVDDPNEDAISVEVLCL